MKIYSCKNPYEPDRLVNSNLLALTKKNSDFIESVINLDSNYKKETNKENGPEKGFDLKANANNAKGKYCGSIHFWFNEMQNKDSKYSYEDCILGSVISIDRSNSTHLETTKNGRQLMAQKIVEKCKCLDDLKKELNIKYENDIKNHLISYLVSPKTEQINRFYLSFVSKFCSYASLYLHTEIQYSKYDSVVAQNLPKYYNQYCGKNIKDNEYKINDSSLTYKYKKESLDAKCSRVLEIYKNYSCAIGELLDIVKNENLDRNKLDHIIWYGCK